MSGGTTTRHTPAGPRARYEHLLRIGLLTLLALANVYLLATFFAYNPISTINNDWTHQYAGGSLRVLSGHLYDWVALPYGESPWVYRYSPVLAYAFLPLLPIGAAGWTALHFAALLALPRRIALVAVVSLPFWSDVWAGQSLIFVLVAATAALGGKRWAVVAFFALAVMMPRPLMLPVLVWLLWTSPWARRAFVAVAVVHALLVLATGLGTEWVGALLRSTDDIGAPWDSASKRVQAITYRR